MMILLSIAGAVFALGLCLMIVSILTAPEGVEDANGFHRIARHSKKQASAGHPALSLKRHASAA